MTNYLRYSSQEFYSFHFDLKNVSKLILIEKYKKKIIFKSLIFNVLNEKWAPYYAHRPIFQPWLWSDVCLNFGFPKKEKSAFLKASVTQTPCLTLLMLLTHPVSVSLKVVNDVMAFMYVQTSHLMGRNTCYSPHHHTDETLYFHLTSKIPMSGLTGIYITINNKDWSMIKG